MLAQSIASGALTTLVFGKVTAGRALVVIVMDAIFHRLFFPSLMELKGLIVTGSSPRKDCSVSLCADFRDRFFAVLLHSIQQFGMDARGPPDCMLTETAFLYQLCSTKDRARVTSLVSGTGHEPEGRERMRRPSV